MTESGETRLQKRRREYNQRKRSERGCACAEKEGRNQLRIGAVNLEVAATIPERRREGGKTERDKKGASITAILMEGLPIGQV